MALTRRDVLRAFAESNARAIDAAGGMDQVSSDGSFDAVNQRYGLAGVRRVRTLREAIDAVLPTGRPFKVEAIDVATLNETRPAQECGGFRLPDDAEERLWLADEESHYAEATGFGEGEIEMEVDDTEEFRRARLVELNSQAAQQRAEAEERHGQVWTTEEMGRDFDVTGFMAPFVVVTRRSDGAVGSLEFQHSPRFYFNWQSKNGDKTMSIQTNNTGKANGMTMHKTQSGATVAIAPPSQLDEITRLRAENAALAAALKSSGSPGGPRALSFKVSEKGAVSVYGMGRFPITLYGEQWDRLLDDNQVKALKAFVEANRSKLSKKADK